MVAARRGPLPEPQWEHPHAPAGQQVRFDIRLSSGLPSNCNGVGENVGDVNRSALERGAAGGRASPRHDRMPFHELLKVGRVRISTPMGVPSRSKGTPRMVRTFENADPAVNLNSGSAILSTT